MQSMEGKDCEQFPLVGIAKKVVQQHYGVVVEDVLDAVKGCDAQNVSKLVCNYIDLHPVELAYICSALLDDRHRLLEFETMDKFVPLQIILTIIRHPSKFRGRIWYTMVQTVVHNWLVYDKDYGTRMLLQGLDLHQKTYEEVDEALTAFTQPDRITDDQLDLCWRLAWLVWGKLITVETLMEYLSTSVPLPIITQEQWSKLFHTACKLSGITHLYSREKAKRDHALFLARQTRRERLWYWWWRLFCNPPPICYDEW